MTSASPFSAAAAALGYVYQLRYSLMRALDAIRSGSYEWTIAIEAADDIEIVDDSSRELRQLKQVGRPLTDSSTDLWKTLRIWSDGVGSGQLDPVTCRLYLVTTASTPTGSAASLLSSDKQTRDEAAAESLLLAVCKNSTSNINKKAYEAYMNLPVDRRIAMLRAISILPQSPDTAALRSHIVDAVRVGSRREYIDVIADQLEGWWFNKCIDCLMDQKDRITAEQLDSFMSDLRDQFSPSNLPIDPDIIDQPEPQLELFEDRTLVRQARLVEISDRRIQLAVRDYLRAFAQRSRWARLNLIQPDELENYERVLREEWEFLFEQLRDEVGSAAAEAEKVLMAKRIYKWVESADVPPIRSQCTEAFVKRGSYHMLADKLHVGWHPDFVKRLAEILEPVSA